MPVATRNVRTKATSPDLKVLVVQQLGPIIFVLVVVAAAAISPAADIQPNVVLIISDDQTYTDFGFMGNEEIRTPNFDDLALRSARYVNGYVPSSVCRPSLVTILTGLYPHQHGVHFNHPPPGFAKLTKSPEVGKTEFDAARERATRFVRGVPTLPRLLASHGYRCFQTGKYWEGHWRNAGFTEGMTIAEPSGGANGDKMLAHGDVVAHGNGDHGLAIGRETMQPIYDFLDDCGETPFLVWYAPFLPHTPHDSPKKFFDLYKGDSAIPKHRVPYYAAISQFDETVGNLVEAIEQRNLTENTIFVFVVDNGWEADAKRFVKSRGEWDHTKRSKRAPFDYGLRTPILIRWDGVTKSATHDELVSSVDIMPTLLAACGVNGEQIDLPGLDLMPSACGEAKLREDRAVFGEIYSGDASSLGNPSQDVAYRWVRQRNLKLITVHSQDGKTPWNNYLASDALFDVEDDPDESQNLIGNPDYVSQVESLRHQLNEWWTPDG